MAVDVSAGPVFDYGFCECGCGQRTKLNEQNVSTRGLVKGEPRRFVYGHGGRSRRKVSADGSRQFCPECRGWKALSEFHRPPSWGGRTQTYCKPCASTRNKVWQAKNKGRRRRYRRELKLKEYGLTPGEFKAMRAAQGGRCAICKARDGDQVDHCHRTGTVRALLCGGCNRVLANAGDDPDVLSRAIDYLLSFPVGARAEEAA